MRNSRFVLDYYNVEDARINTNLATMVLFFIGNRKIIRLRLSNDGTLYYKSANKISHYMYEEEELVLHPQFFYQKIFT